jgi:steroid delta-isomerase-like uncharacterized protein
MSTEMYKDIVRRWVADGWNQGNLALVDEMYSPNYTMHDPSLPNQMLVGTEAFKGFVSAFRTAMPDFHFTIEDLVAEGDKIAWRFTATGTQKGELMGIPPTGNKGTATGSVISRFENGQWTEDWVNWDTLGFLQQLGVIPKMG